MALKVGDKVKFKNGGDKAVIFEVRMVYGGLVYVECELGKRSYLVEEYNVEVISNNITNPMTNIEKFTLLFKSEPQKSFRKSGITDGDDLLTTEGTKIFLTWLLNKNQDAFKTEVVDGLLKEEK